MQSGAHDTGTEVPQDAVARKKQFGQEHPRVTFRSTPDELNAIRPGWAGEGTS